MTTMTSMTQPQERVPLIDLLSQRVERPVETMPDWLAGIREEATRRFLELGLPTLKDEDWRLTSLRPLELLRFSTSPEASALRESEVAKLLFPGLDGPRLVFVNGRYCPEASSTAGLPREITVARLQDAGERERAVLRNHLARYASAKDPDPFTLLNTALFEDVSFVHVPRGVTFETPIWLVHVSECRDAALLTSPRTLVVAEESSRVTVVEDCVGRSGSAAYFTNAVTEISVGANADVHHYLLERESPSAINISSLKVHQERDSRFVSHSVLLGGALIRNNVNPVLDGEGCHSVLNGLYVGDGTRHMDNLMRVEHAKPHCDSRQYYKGILSDSAHGVFSGRIVVAKGAQKTDAVQRNANLLLSPSARANTKPQLEIYADDVKCTHGATVGQLDDEAVFYLRSRGLDEAAARGLLVYAFAREALDRMEYEPIRRGLVPMLVSRLPQSHTIGSFLD